MHVEKATYKVQFRMGDNGRTQEEFVTVKKENGPPSKTEAKKMLQKRPAFAMMQNGAMKVLRINKVDEFTEGTGHPGLL